MDGFPFPVTLSPRATLEVLRIRAEQDRSMHLPDTADFLSALIEVVLCVGGDAEELVSCLLENEPAAGA